MKNYKFEIFFFVFILVLLLLLVASARAQETAGQELSGGQFSIVKTVVAGGGGSAMQQSQAEVNNTAGQAVAGRLSSGGSFTLYTGFWTPETFAPTAATVTVGGRVQTADGAGIRNAVISIIFQTGETRTVKSASFGYYKFEDIPVGETYVFQVAAKRYVFPQPVVVRSILEETQDVDFVAAP